MKLTEETLPVFITKFSAYTSLIVGFIMAVYYGVDEKYLLCAMYLISGIVTYGVLMTIVKIAIWIDDFRTLK